MTSSIVFQPYMPWSWLALGYGGVLVVLVLAALRRSRGLFWRWLAFSLLFVFLTGPRQISENREKQSDIVLAIVDESESQTMVAGRLENNEIALAALKKRLQQEDNLELRILRFANTKRDADGTNLYEEAGRVLSSIPKDRLGAVVMITDGQVHDSPDELIPHVGKAPVHALITGQEKERDRRMVIDKVPGYGLVGGKINLKYRVEDQGMVDQANLDRLVDVIIRLDGQDHQRLKIPVGVPQKFEFELTHAGQTIVEIEAAPVEGELTTLNNRQVVGVNGVRDRLRVLLVSGQPHAGERAWRNLLKSDPAVDLFHFTILRPPEKSNPTPRNELSLIVFPVNELFVKRLKEFDLIVFDRYLVRHVLSPAIFKNIRDYIAAGGAVLVSSGPEYAGPRSLFETPLGRMMAVQPTGLVLERAFVPTITDLGSRHPVTAGLSGQDGKQWGRWFRQVEGIATSGKVLMAGAEETPLLVLDRIGEGRIAQLMSDHIWLWARGFDGGGPQAELMRRIAHWLMKEPELEEEALRAQIRDGLLTVTRTSLTNEPADVTVKDPGGNEQRHRLKADGDGRATLQVEAPALGLYRVTDGERTALAAAGKLNRQEYADLRSTTEVLAPDLEKTGGGLYRIETGMPDIRPVKTGWDQSGQGWMGVRQNGAYQVSGTFEKPLVPGWLFLLVGACLMAASWWREGH